MTHSFTCFQCKENKTHESDFTTGYGNDKDGNKICFDCCGKNDLAELMNLPIGGKTTQYFNGKQVINWPSTLKITPNYVKNGRHNIAGSRIDVWFGFDGLRFHGVQYGSNTQIIHIKRIARS